MTVGRGDGFLHLHRVVLGIQDGAEHAGDRRPL